MPLSILWPTFALVALIIVIWWWLFLARMGHIRRNPPRREDFATGEDALRYFQPVEMPANNYRNLFEMPVLYFALVPLLMITHQANSVQVTLAWVYVALRVLHSVIHVVVKHVPTRAMVYWLSSGVLMAMWIGFFVDIWSASARYDAVMANLTS
ncbi:MAG: MAPEG family protein [Pseudomonadota bacterium]